MTEAGGTSAPCRILYRQDRALAPCLRLAVGWLVGWMIGWLEPGSTSAAGSDGRAGLVVLGMSGILSASSAHLTPQGNNVCSKQGLQADT